ncbi:hypothetical protein D3C76_1660000 [compost metagenome]
MLSRQQSFLSKIGGTFTVTLPKLGERLFAEWIVLQQREFVHELVTGGAIHRPVAVQGFTFAKDLFDVDGQVPARR